MPSYQTNSASLASLATILKEAADFNDRQSVGYKMHDPRVAGHADDYYRVMIEFDGRQRDVILTREEVIEAIRQFEEFVELPVTAWQLHEQFLSLNLARQKLG